MNKSFYHRIMAPSFPARINNIKKVQTEKEKDKKNRS